MFQYAFGRRLSIERGVPLFVDTHLLEDHSSGRHEVTRKYALDIFSSSVRHAPLWRTLKYSAWGLPRWARGLVKLTHISSESRQIREPGFGYYPTEIPESDSAYLTGLWQSPRYFESCEQQIREDFQFRRPVLPEASELAHQIAHSESVCVHVRRTDYVTNRSSGSPLGFVGENYYRKGLERIHSILPDATFYVFSDDISWCRENLAFIPQAVFVENDFAGYKDGCHLQLMTLCKHFLIPNSTFSWWAAWLSAYPDKQVFLPSCWFNDESLDARGFYLNGWHQIENRLDH